MVRAILVVVLVAAGCVACTSGAGGDDRHARSPVPPSAAVVTSASGRTDAALWHRQRSGAFSVRYPSAWVATRYTGAPATVTSPLFFLSEHRLPRYCAGGGGGVPSAGQGGTLCFDGTWPVPSNGVVVTWREDEYPSSAQYRLAPGRRTVIDGHAAKLYAGDPHECTDGASSEVDADIDMTTDPATMRLASDDYVMTACLGPHLPARERADVYRMLASVRIGT